MSRAQVLEIKDDLDGDPIEDDLVVIEFSVNGSSYSLDLREANAQQFEADMGPWIERASWTGGRKVQAPIAEPTTANITRQSVAPKKKAAKPAAGRGKEELKAIRQWANESGYEVSPRGRIADEIIEAYDLVH